MTIEKMERRKEALETVKCKLIVEKAQIESRLQRTRNELFDLDKLIERSRKRKGGKQHV